MVKNIAKIIVKNIFALALLILIIQSSMIIPAYFNFIFDIHALSSKGARSNYISTIDVNNLKKNITNDFSNNHFEDIVVSTEVLEIGSEGNVNYSVGDQYPILPSLTKEQVLQRGDRYVIQVEAEYNFLMPDIFSDNTNATRKVGSPIVLSYEIPLTCLKFIKE